MTPLQELLKILGDIKSPITCSELSPLNHQLMLWKRKYPNESVTPKPAPVAAAVTSPTSTATKTTDGTPAK